MSNVDIAYVITGRGARIKHINHDGTVLCGRDNATQPAKNRFEKLPVCEACTEALEALEAAETDETPTVEDAIHNVLANPGKAGIIINGVEQELVVVDEQVIAEMAADAEEIVTVHFSARVTRHMAAHLAARHPELASDLADARNVRNGRGYTAFTTTTRPRAEVLVEELRALLKELESGKRDKGKKGGMNFQPEAIEKGLEHINGDLAEATA